MGLMSSPSSSLFSISPILLFPLPLLLPRMQPAHQRARVEARRRRGDAKSTGKRWALPPLLSMWASWSTDECAKRRTRRGGQRGRGVGGQGGGGEAGKLLLSPNPSSLTPPPTREEGGGGEAGVGAGMEHHLACTAYRTPAMVGNHVCRRRHHHRDLDAPPIGQVATSHLPSLLQLGHRWHRPPLPRSTTTPSQLRRPNYAAPLPTTPLHYPRPNYAAPLPRRPL